MLLGRRIAITSVVIVLMLGGPAIADSNADLKMCDSITARSKRDRCFYTLQLQLSDAARNMSSETVSKWQVNKESSRVDGSDVVISLNADASIFGRPSKRDTASLILRCKDRKTSVYILTGMSPQNYVYGPDGRVVTIQLDNGKPTRHHVLESIDETAIVLEKSVALINRLTKHNTMFLTFAPYNSSPALATFDLRGLAGAVKSLGDICKW